jgi:phosphatidylglycerol:prolipoprotein diacylglycerol transferase
MLIKGAYHHPTFLYESCLNLIGLIFILNLRKKSKKLLSGDIIFIYMIWYGIVRAFTETLRAGGDASDPLMLGPIHVSRAIAIIGFICGIVGLVLKHNITKLKTEPYYQIKEDVNKTRIDTVIFDLDGTLLDTKSLIDHSFIYTFQHYFPSLNITKEELDSFFGPTLEDTFSRYTKDKKLINEMINYYRVYNKEHHDEFVKAFPGAKGLLRALHYKGYKVCVVSSKIKNMVEYGLMHNGMLKYVDYIIGEGQIIPKPNPEGIIRAMDHFKFSKNAIYIGDNPSDINAGINADNYFKEHNIDKTCKACGVAYSLKFDEIKNITPSYMVNELEEILDIINA